MEVRVERIKRHSKSTFAQDSQVLTHRPSPLFALVRFQAPPP